MDIFEKATRAKLRFNTSKGLLMVEQLWDLPLTSSKDLSLNEIGIGIQKALREMGEGSLVKSATKDPNRDKAQLRLDVIKRIIEVKETENAEARAAAETKAEKERLLEALARKQDEKVENLSEEEIRARIAAL